MTITSLYFTIHFREQEQYIYIYNISKNKQYQEDNIINKLKALELKKSSDKFCGGGFGEKYIYKNGQILIGVSKAKTNCGGIPIIGDEYKTVYYVWNPMNNSLTFSYEELWNDYYEYQVNQDGSKNWVHIVEGKEISSELVTR